MRLKICRPASPAGLGLICHSCFAYNGVSVKDCTVDSELSKLMSALRWSTLFVNLCASVVTAALAYRYAFGLSVVLSGLMLFGSCEALLPKHMWAVRNIGYKPGSMHVAFVATTVISGMFLILLIPALAMLLLMLELPTDGQSPALVHHMLVTILIMNFGYVRSGLYLQDEFEARSDHASGRLIELCKSLGNVQRLSTVPLQALLVLVILILSFGRAYMDALPLILVQAATLLSWHWLSRYQHLMRANKAEL